MREQMSILDIRIQTFPSPLAAAQSGKIYVIIQKTDEQVQTKCREIKVAVQWGTEASALVESVEDVSACSDDRDQWDAGKEGIEQVKRKGINYLLIHFIPKTEAAANLEKPACFWISCRVSKKIGTSGLLTQGIFGEGEPEVQEFEVEKGLAEFYLRNFLSKNSSQVSYPCTAFKKNTPIWFSWESSGESFALYAAGRPEAITETEKSSFCLQGGVSESTTFILRAAIERLEPMYLYETLTIEIEDPVVESMELWSCFSGKGAKVNLFGTPVRLELPQADSRSMWLLTAETDGYLIGNLDFCFPASGSGRISARVCTAEEYEVEETAFSGQITIDGNAGIPINKKASLCVPVPAGIPVSLSYLISYLSIPEQFRIQFTFLPLGKGGIRIT